MLIFTLYTEDGVDKYQVQAMAGISKDGTPEMVDVTSEYSVLPMRITDQENGQQLQGFFFGHDSMEEDEEKEIEKLPHASCPNWED